MLSPSFTISTIIKPLINQMIQARCRCFLYCVAPSKVLGTCKENWGQSICRCGVTDHLIIIFGMAVMFNVWHHYCSWHTPVYDYLPWCSQMGNIANFAMPILLLEPPRVTQYGLPRRCNKESTGNADISEPSIVGWKPSNIIIQRWWRGLFKQYLTISLINYWSYQLGYNIDCVWFRYKKSLFHEINHETFMWYVLLIRQVGLAFSLKTIFVNMTTQLILSWRSRHDLFFCSLVTPYKLIHVAFAYMH